MPRPPGHIPVPAFADDEGRADPRLAAALAAFGQGTGERAEVLQALVQTRLLVPVVAFPADADAGEAAGDRAHSGTDLAAVSTTGRDGRRGQLAFTAMDTLQRWSPSARPVPVAARDAAKAALTDGADALVIDLAGPVVFALEGAELRAVAAGWRPVRDPGGGTAWAVPVGQAWKTRPPGADDAPSL